MREYVSIGIGREARKTYDLFNVGILPSRRTRSSKEVDLSWNLDAYHFTVPLLAHPTDALVDPAFAIEMHKQGGLAVLNAEGVLGRHPDYKAAIEQIKEPLVAEKDEWQGRGHAAIAKLQELHTTPIDYDLLTERIAEVRDAGATVAVRVSPQRARELAPVVVKAGAEILFIQGTHTSAEHMEATGEALNLKEFIGTLEVPVVAGGVSDYATAIHLMRAGAAGVIVGENDTTSEFVLGIEVGMATAIADVAAARRDYMDESGGRYVHVIADAVVDQSGKIARAIACGADAVMLSSCLAHAEEAAADGFYWQSVAAHPELPRAFVEANYGRRPMPLAKLLHGPSTDPFGTENLAGALRRAIAKAGFTDVKSFQKVDLTIV